MTLFTSDSMAGQVVMVAGGSSGINLGIAQRMAAQGAKVAIISRNADRVAAAVAGIQATGAEALGWSADVRDYDAVAACFARLAAAWGPVDVVVSGAAGNFIAPALGLSANAFKTVVDIDLIGTFNVFRASFEHLRRPGASLVAITAPQGAHPAMFQAHACAAKAGVNMLTKCLALEWGQAGVRVNAISPGPIADTEGMSRLAPGEEMARRIDASIPLRRHGTRADIADAALFLASREASYVTGAIFDCDGGLSLGDSSANAIDVEPRR